MKRTLQVYLSVDDAHPVRRIKISRSVQLDARVTGITVTAVGLVD